MAKFVAVVFSIVSKAVAKFVVGFFSFLFVCAKSKHANCAKVCCCCLWQKHRCKRIVAKFCTVAKAVTKFVAVVFSVFVCAKSKHANCAKVSCCCLWQKHRCKRIVARELWQSVARAVAKFVAGKLC